MKKSLERLHINLKGTVCDKGVILPSQKPAHSVNSERPECHIHNVQSFLNVSAAILETFHCLR